MLGALTGIELMGVDEIRKSIWVFQTIKIAKEITGLKGTDLKKAVGCMSVLG